MSPLKRRMLEDMQLRNPSAGTQRSYIHYVTDDAYYYNLSPAKLGLDDIRNYQLYLIEKRQLSPNSINCFLSAVQFLYTVTLEMPWSKARVDALLRFRSSNVFNTGAHRFDTSPFSRPSADENLYRHKSRNEIFPFKSTR